MKITQLQKDLASCECGNVTKSEKHSPVKCKMYETRSGAFRKQVQLNGFKPKLELTKIKSKNKKFITKIETAILPSVTRNGTAHKLGIEKMDINSKTTGDLYNNIDSIMKNGYEKCQPTPNGVETKLFSSLEIDKHQNGEKEDNVVADSYLPQKRIKLDNIRSRTISSAFNEKINGIKSEENLALQKNGNIVNSLIAYDSSDDEEKVDKTYLEFENLDDDNSCNDYDKNAMKKRKYRRRKNIELFLKETCESLKLDTIACKRVRKIPSYSPLKKEKIDDIRGKETTEKTKLTLSGLPRKKGGRKPIYKGPIHHYLDMFTKEKNTKHKDMNNIENISSDNEELMIPSRKMQLSTSSQTDAFTQPSKKESKSSSTKKSSKIPVVKERRNSSKLKVEACEYDSPVTNVLGYRINKTEKEMLVLFENGTSNWIPHIDKNFDDLQTFYQHDEQDFSTYHRLGYQAVCSEDDNISDYYYSSSCVDTDNDDDVFMTTTNYRCGESTFDKDGALNQLLDYVISSHNTKLYSCENKQEVVLRKQEDFFHVYLKQPIVSKDDADISTTELCMVSCKRLITILEDCSFNEKCKAAVISGIEDFFSSNSVFEKLLRQSATSERMNFEQDIAVIRYLIQTIWNFDKPLIAVIKKSANGLSASILSLFDMVFHEETKKNGTPVTKRKMKKKKGFRRNSLEKLSAVDYPAENLQLYIFPRLLGISKSNEAKMMGEHLQWSPPKEQASVLCLNGSLSGQLKCSLQQMKKNCKNQCYRSRTYSEKCLRSSVSDSINSSPSKSPGKLFAESAEELARLEKQIKEEKELAEKYIADLQISIFQ